ncbi:hypothetical protein OAK75_12500 [Bacteriovoracales bacterium]|nr:hypothetical protein [Bacteriovoracales bacterium]
MLLVACSTISIDEDQLIVPKTWPTTEFGPGLYYRQPFLDLPGGLLTSLGRLPLSTTNVEAFDIRPEAAVYAVNDQLVLVTPDGNANSFLIPGIHQMDRPSFSPDGKKVVVQARETYTEPEDINIYIVDLKTKKFKRISHLDINEESPEWFTNQNKIAYTSFGPHGLVAHIYDVDSGMEIQTIPGGGSIHLTVSPDGSLLFNPVLARLYNVATGKMVVDLKDKILSAIKDNGYNVDTRFQGQAGQGTFPMDADFSPNGNHIVFDGAVEKNGKFGLIIFKMTTSGDNITPITRLIKVNPAFSNNNNYSQLAPNWFRGQVKYKP